jgi:hypothetical protein
MDDKKNNNLEDKLIEAGRGIPKEHVDQSFDTGSKKTNLEQPDNLDELIRKAGA